VWEGQVAERVTPGPLNTTDLLGKLDDPAREPFRALSRGTVMGHVHLKVAGINETVDTSGQVRGRAPVHRHRRRTRRGRNT
jgi:catechol-2,3-dioxygenase